MQSEDKLEGGGGLTMTAGRLGDAGEMSKRALMSERMEQTK
jgi:hypothetical protein